jgi:hypothetical protein
VYKVRAKTCSANAKYLNGHKCNRVSLVTCKSTNATDSLSPFQTMPNLTKLSAVSSTLSSTLLGFHPNLVFAFSFELIITLFNSGKIILIVGSNQLSTLTTIFGTAIVGTFFALIGRFSRIILPMLIMSSGFSSETAMNRSPAADGVVCAKIWSAATC